MSDELKPGTPLPWKVDGDKVWEVTDDNGNAIAATFSDNGWGLADSNAAYIVEACNNYKAQATRIAELEGLLSDTEFMRGAMQADLEAAGKLLGCDFDQVLVYLEEQVSEVKRLKGMLKHYQFVEDDGGKWCVECGQYPHVCGKTVACSLAKEIASWDT